LVYLKEATATQTVQLGPFVDDADGKTTEESLTLSQADLQLTKNGGSAAQKNDATSATHLYGGNYKVPLNTTDTNTLGCLTLMCKESGALPVVAHFMVVTANWYDSMCSTDVLDVSVTQWLGTAAATPSVAGVPEVDLTHVAGATTNVAALATNVDAILTDTGTTLDTKLNTIDDFLDTEIAAILADTNELQTDLVNGGRLDLLIDAIKAKTDSLTYTVAGQVDANIQSINDVTVIGAGTSGDKWRA
jgi:hypothetical protein